MPELLITQIVCILLPIFIFGLIYLGIRLLARRPERFAFRMDLSLMGLALTIIGLLFVWMKNPAGRSPEFEQVMICLLSGLTFPAVWFLQFLLDARRDQQARRAAEKLRELKWIPKPADRDSPARHRADD